MITSSSYYKGKIAIANAQDTAPNSNLLGNRASLNESIEKYERDVLVKLFGYDLFKLFKAEFDIDATTGVWTIKTGTAQKWKDLLTGKEYTLNGVNVTWKGLIFSEGGANNKVDQSLLANYVYAKWIEDNEVNHSGVGFINEIPKGAIQVSNRSKWANALNEFYKLVVKGSNGVRSLYQFLGDMNALDSTTYPNWVGEDFKLVNRYGL
jgi:hypothetical protein